MLIGYIIWHAIAYVCACLLVAFFGKRVYESRMNGLPIVYYFPHILLEIIWILF